MRDATVSTSVVERCSKAVARRSASACMSDDRLPFDCRCCSSAVAQLAAAAVVAAPKPALRPSSWRCTAPVTVACIAALSRASPARVASVDGCRAATTARALASTPVFSTFSSTPANCACAASLRSWKALWLATSRSPAAAFCVSIDATIACRRSTRSGINAACCCSRRKDSSRWNACECMCSELPISASSACTTSARSRRHSAASRPSTADVATPAIEVPKAKPRPFTGAASEPRIASMSVALSSARPVPRSVTIMPSRVPSMPSSTSRPTTYGVSAGAGRATRPPSIRWRTDGRRLACNDDSHADSPSLAADVSASAEASEAVAWR